MGKRNEENNRRVNGFAGQGSRLHRMGNGLVRQAVVQFPSNVVSFSLFLHSLGPNVGKYFLMFVLYFLLCLTPIIGCIDL